MNFVRVENDEKKNVEKQIKNVIQKVKGKFMKDSNSIKAKSLFEDDIKKQENVQKNEISNSNNNEKVAKEYEILTTDILTTLEKKKICEIYNSDFKCFLFNRPSVCYFI